MIERIGKNFSTKTVLVVVTFLLMTLAVFVAVGMNNSWRVAAACSPLDTTRGVVTKTVNVPSTGSYRVWTRIKPSTADNNSHFLEIGTSTCGVVVGDNASLEADEWQWVDYRNGDTSSKLTYNLTAGNHTVKLVGREDDVAVDKVMFVSDHACIPAGDGNNCITPVVGAALNGGRLYPGQRLVSPNGSYRLVLQTDGNLVLYRNSDNAVRWASNTVGRSPRYLTLQTDGNLVLYPTSGSALWASNTSGLRTAGQLRLQDDGNVVLYNSGRPVWATNTTAGVRSNLFAPAKLAPREFIRSTDGRYRLVMQTDGNLVIYSPKRAIWSSKTARKSVRHMAMQTDGNLVLYGTNGRPLWASNSSRKNGFRLVMQTDGNLVIYSKTGRPVWASNTVGRL